MNVSLIFAAIVLALAFTAGCATINAEKNAPPIGEFVEVDGERMHVLDAGPRDSVKPPVVLIHGASVNLRDMKIALGDELAKDRRVIMVDRPGHGYSSRPKEGHQLETQARYIRGAIDKIGVEQPVVVGQSFGGAVALRYGLQYQDDMAGLVLLAPVSHEWPGGVAWYNNVSGIPVIGFLLRRLVIPVYGQIVGKGSVASSFEPGAAPPDYFDKAGVPLLFRAGEFKANASDIRHLKEEIIAQQGRYGELTLPVAIVVGEEDDTVSPDLHAKRLPTEIDDATLLVLPDTGHTLHHAETEKILSVIEDLGLSVRLEPATAEY